MIIGILLGTAVAIMRMSANPVLRWAATGYIWLFRGIPALLQLLLWFNLALIFPTLSLFGFFPINTVDVMTPFVAALLGLGIQQGAYTAEVVRSGILSVDRGQMEAAQSIGIPLNRIWVIVWCVAGVVALVAGMIWGSKLGVQFSLTTVALRALPVVILGGLTSVPGAIIGGLIIGVGEKLSEVYLGPYVGGGIEIWFAYVLALVFLLFRPQGLFGEKIIDRV